MNISRGDKPAMNLAAQPRVYDESVLNLRAYQLCLLER